MFGFALEEEHGGGGPVAVAPRRPETSVLVARMAVPPAPARADAIDRLIAGLVAAGIWDRLDTLLVLAAHDAQAALLNWTGVGFPASVGGGAPVFVPDRGFFCDGFDDWIDTGLSPAAGVRFQQNDAVAAAWFRRDGRNANSPVGTITASAVTINPRGSSDASASRLNGATSVSGGTVATGYGLTAVDRSGTTLRQFVGGAILGAPAPAPATASSSARSSARIGLGRANGGYADGQFCAFAAGGSLTAEQHAALQAALGAYMDAVGAAALPAPTTRSLALTAAHPLPDGAAPVRAGKGMGVTGLARRPDGRWYVGNGSTSRRPLLFTRMSADFSVAEAEFTTAGLELGAEHDGSVQGMTLDTSDGTIWFLVKLSGANGATTHLHHFDPATELPIGSPVAVAPSETGLAYDPALDGLWITRDLGSGDGALVLYDKAGAAVSGSTATPGDTEQCFMVGAASGSLRAGDLLITAGGNGAAGTVNVYGRLDYGGMARRRVDTLVGADAIEGLVLAGGEYVVGNDAATHPGDPALNRVLRYPA